LKTAFREYPVTAAFIISCSVFVGATFWFSKTLAIAEAAVFLLFILIAIVRFKATRKKTKKRLVKLADRLDFSKRTSLESFPLPLLVCDNKGKIIWYNKLFYQSLIENSSPKSGLASDFTAGYSAEEIISSGSINVDFASNSYSVYAGRFIYGNNNYYALYFVDDTSLKETVRKYFATRPVVLLIETDNIDELNGGYKESERAEIRSGIEALIENWAGRFTCIMRKLRDNRFMIVAEENNLREMIDGRFAILDQVRRYTYKEKVLGTTLSIGVGSGGGTLKDCENYAGKALDMALGRGGDQAAVKTSDSYEFFGGVSKSTEKRAKVRTRVIASSITELFNNSENILIMGHSYADLDAMGAAVGILSAARRMGKQAYIATDAAKSLAGPILNKLKSQGLGSFILNESDAIEKLTSKSLLVILDTHIERFVEFKQLYKKAPSVVVIDHHRKSVDFIGNAIVFFHDPGASSASEMVTELLQYMQGIEEIGKIEAEALLAGIMLDTKNFVLHAGVRTFEAAAYLKSRGAGMVEVKKMFATSLETQKLKNSVTNNSEVFMGCAISLADFDSPDIRIICAQAADELLNISGIDASFVLFVDAGAVNISARSLGAINVQLIMEALGGGGHQTMAAAQMEGASPETAVIRLQAAISEYYTKNMK